MNLSQIKALTFDVFGTVVDWRSSIIREGEALGRRKGINIDWARVRRCVACGLSACHVQSTKR